MGDMTKAKAEPKGKGGQPCLFGEVMKLYPMRYPAALIARLDRYVKHLNRELGKRDRTNRSEIMRQLLEDVLADWEAGRP